jgi:hypothetical protein
MTLFGSTIVMPLHVPASPAINCIYVWFLFFGLVWFGMVFIYFLPALTSITVGSFPKLSPNIVMTPPVVATSVAELTLGAK